MKYALNCGQSSVIPSGEGMCPFLSEILGLPLTNTALTLSALTTQEREHWTHQTMSDITQ